MEDQSATPADQIRLALLQKLESLQRAGVRQLPRPPQLAMPPLPGTPAGVASAPAPAAAKPVPKRQASPRPEPLATPPAPASSPKPRPPVPAPAAAADSPEPTEAQPPTSIETLRLEVAACQRCGELASTRTQTVFGVGPARPRLCFLGEAPGADEDRQGEPFVGAAGQLLNKIIEACTLKRQEVYILNVLKCRPPGNRTPSPEEVANCRRFFERQLALLEPEFICCLGAVAAQALLRTTRSLTQLRGRFHEWQGRQVLATFHPAYLLRYPEKKKDAWADMKLLMQALGLARPE